MRTRGEDVWDPVGWELVTNRRKRWMRGEDLCDRGMWSENNDVCKEWYLGRIENKVDGGRKCYMNFGEFSFQAAKS